jgi:hypothetical protein
MSCFRKVPLPAPLQEDQSATATIIPQSVPPQNLPIPYLFALEPKSGVRSNSNRLNVSQTQHSLCTTANRCAFVGEYPRPRICRVSPANPFGVGLLYTDRMFAAPRMTNSCCALLLWRWKGKLGWAGGGCGMCMMWKGFDGAESAEYVDRV